jgi:hypothetical protein
MTKRKRKAEIGQPTVIAELVERLTEIDRRICGHKVPEARVQVLAAEEQFVIGQIAAATPASLADCAALLMIAADRAETMRAVAEDEREKSPAMVARDSAHAAELSSAVARVLRFVAAKADVDLDKIGARLFLDDNDHFPEYRPEVAAKAA